MPVVAVAEITCLRGKIKAVDLFVASLVSLCGSMLNGKELEIAKQLLNEVKAEANKAGDKDVYRFDFTPQTGDLGMGNDWHPSLWQHEKMAAELAAYLRALMHWF